MKRSLALALLASLLAAPAVMAQPPTKPTTQAPTKAVDPKATPAPAQPAKKDDKAKDSKPGAMDDQKKAWDDAAAVGPNHNFLEQLVGEWQTEAKDLSPGQETTDKGTMTNTMVFGKRFLNMEYDGRFHGQFFRGGGMWGYNNTDKRFESSWADSAGTSLGFMTGAVSADGKVFTMTGEVTNPATGKKMAQKEVTTVTSKDSYKLEIYMDGVKNMEISFVKGKAAEKAVEKKDEKPKAK